MRTPLDRVPAHPARLYLAPEIVGALLAGRHPIELTPIRLLRLSKNLPHGWKEQRRFLGFAA
jgi:site-specific DNA recombinase